MTIPSQMWAKAQELIAADAYRAWEEKNRLPNGRVRKRHRPYTISTRAEMMVKALGSGDAKAVSLLILNWAYPGI